jgi:outer membrane protein OmpA-like peptidoglycan-associated protein
MKTTSRIVKLGALALATALGGCATQDYVKEQVSPVQAQVGELRTQVQAQDAGLKALDGRVKGSEDRIQALQQEALARAQAASAAAAQPATASAPAVPAPGFAMSVILSDDRIKFRRGHAELSSEGAAELDQLVGRLKSDNQPVFLEIQGHTDATGSPEVNQRLGQLRADAVRQHLARAGMPVLRMATISYGESAPMADNKTADGRSQNRRVQLVVLR